MTRRPRSKNDHLVTLTLMSQAYGYIGWTQFWGALFCYYVVANDFGFPPAELQFKANINIFVPGDNDVYNPSAWNFGNSKLSATNCSSNSGEMADWIYTVHAKIDLRLAALKCNQLTPTIVSYTPLIAWGPCHVQQISPFSNKPACYSTEGMKYAQSGYFYGVVIAQLLNHKVCKTRKLSVFTQGIGNTFAIFSMTT